MTPRPLLPLLIALALSACATGWPPGFVGPGGWVPDLAASPTPWNHAMVAGNVAGDRFIDGDWR
jgi:hypothetical protein